MFSEVHAIKKIHVGADTRQQLFVRPLFRLPASHGFKSCFFFLRMGILGRQQVMAPLVQSCHPRGEPVPGAWVLILAVWTVNQQTGELSSPASVFQIS